MKNIRVCLYFLGIVLLSFFLAFWKLDGLDLEASEDIYVADSVGYLRRDPFIAPRQHLRKPHEPASPHPFFVQLLTAEMFKILGLSLFSARFLQAGSLILNTILVMWLARRIFKTLPVIFAAGIVYTTLPLVVRYSRMAVLDPVLASVQGLGALWLWEMIQTKEKTKYLYAVFVGVAIGLSLSIKLTGIFFLIFVGMVFLWKFIKSKSERFSFLLALFIVLVSMGITFYLFTDPASYSYGWTHFSDPKHKAISFSSTLKGISATSYWAIFSTTLIGLIPSLLFVISLPKILWGWKSTRKIFIFSWMTASVYIFVNPSHITGLSSEWAYLPLMLPLGLILSRLLILFWQKWKNLKENFSIFVALIFYLILAVPTLVLFGLRYAPLPLPNLTGGRNAVMDDLAVTKIIDSLNQEDKTVLVFINLRGVILPLWLLNNNITTEPRYHDLTEYNYIVTDDMKLVGEAEAKDFLVLRQEKNPSEVAIYLLQNTKN